LIPYGETSSYRSNPIGFAQFALSRKHSNYFPDAKAVEAVEHAAQVPLTAPKRRTQGVPSLES
jgi:aconitate hydratase